MSSRDTICLVKDFSARGKATSHNVYSKDINWKGNPGDSDKSISIRSLEGYAQAIRSPNQCILRLLYKIVEEEMRFNIYLYTAFTEGLCSTVAMPVLQIKCREETLPTNTAGIALEMRMELMEMLEKSQTDKFILLFSSKVFKSENFIFDIILGWSEGLSKYIPAAKKLTGFNTTDIMKSLFEKDSSKDLTIVSGNGSEIKCHRIICEVHSDVLAAMISPNNGMQESKNGRIEMPENSEVGLTQLIRYFYGNKLNIDEISCDVAIELFKTAHKYKLAGLQTWIAEILLKKGTDWFTPDDLLDLYFHVRNLAEFKAIEENLLYIMLCLAKEVRTCERFKELKRTDAEAAIELLSVLFDMK